MTTTPAGTTTDAYDAIGDLTSVAHSGTAAGYSTPPDVASTYNVDGSRATMTDGTGTTTYSYDAMGHVTETAFAPGSGSGLSSETTQDAYFPAGALESATYPSYTGHSSPAVAYTYDAEGAMASETDWLGNEVAFSHDADGNETAQDNEVSGGAPSGTSGTAYSYDLADEQTSAVTTEACTGGAGTLTQSFAGTGGSRNADGQLTEDSESYGGDCSGSSYERNYSYDVSGRLVYQGATAQGGSADNFHNLPDGFVSQISGHHGSGTFDSYYQSYGQSAAVTTQSPAPGSGGAVSSYGYDQTGDLTSQTAGSATTTYGYDTTGQMTSLQDATATMGYQYSGDGLLAGTQSQQAWQQADPVEGSDGLTGVSCPTTGFCAAVDNHGDALTYNGSYWSRQDVDSTALYGVTCTSASFCVALDGDGHALSWDGSSWSSADVDGSTPFYSTPSCTSSSFCVAVDSDGHALVWNGTSWTSSDIDGSHVLYSVSCTSTTFCVAVDQDGNALTYDGSTWSSSLIDAVYTEFSVSCTSSSFCMAVDEVGNAFEWDGTSWAQTDVDGTTTLHGVSCTSSTFCVAVDQAGVALTFDGTSWSANDVDGSTALAGVSCASTSLCVAVDGDGAALTYDGTGWSAAVVDGGNSFESVSCPTTSFCMAVDNAGHAERWDGTSWSEADADDTALFGVSCTSATFCAAVDDNGDALTWDGTTWASSDVDGASPFYSTPSCTSSSFCVAVGSDGKAFFWDGTTWSGSDIDGSSILYSVSCVSSTFCVAVDQDGHALTYNGSTWSPTTVDSGHTLFSVSCTSTTRCVAVDQVGNALTWDGTGWSSADIDGSAPLRGVSCSGTSFCAAVSATGDTVTWDGTTWSAADTDRATPLAGVSCASASFCVAVDWGGDAISYDEADLPTTQLVWGTTTGSLPLVLSDGTNDYVYGPTGEPVEQVNVTASPPADNPLFLTYTPSDSSWVATSTTGAQLAFWRYDAYGTLAVGTPDSPFGYGGQYGDTSSAPSGFEDLRARWYAPQVGQFTTTDPAFAQTDQAYAYAGGDPVNGGDPSGEIGVTLPVGRDGPEYWTLPQWGLGVDPAHGSTEFNLTEYETARLIEEVRGVTLVRYGTNPRLSTYNRGDIDWTDADDPSITYEGLGPYPSSVLDSPAGEEAFLNSIIEHIDKADYIAIDVRGFTEAQAEAIDDFVAGDDNIFTVGTPGSWVPPRVIYPRVEPEPDGETPPTATGGGSDDGDAGAGGGWDFGSRIHADDESYVQCAGTS